ncbi:MAG: DUF2182 domain-containing protein [Gammaproteobacteria bacterium]
MDHANTAALPLERLLRRDRTLVLLGLGGAALLSWLYLVPAALDMYGEMDGLSAWMMAATWDLRYLALMFGMWSVMMVGMMLPSAAPAILLYGRVVQARAAGPPVARVYAFAGGYLLAWTGFSLVATLVQWGLSRAALVSPMMESRSAALGGTLLIVAGVYQWTAFKQSCLTQCRSPMGFLSRHWRPGVGGALRMGIAHGLYCLGCCWALMGLLFVGGVMNLWCIAGITLFVLLEKLAPYGMQGGRLSGVLLVGAGTWMLIGG